MSPPARAPHTIEVRLEKLEQLFNSMDPAPFHSKHLDSDAEEYIVSQANRVHLDHPVALVVHLQNDGDGATQGLVTEAVRHFFAYKADRAQRDLFALLATGRTTLAIGLLFMGTCVTASELIPQLGSETLTKVVKEGLVIGGWVAMWRPVQIFLYDWWPLARLRKVYIKLSDMPVEVK